MTPAPVFLPETASAYFEVDEVLEYYNRFAGNPELMPVEQARKKLSPYTGWNLSFAEFKRRYFDTNKIEVIDAGAGRYFVSRRDVEKHRERKFGWSDD